MNPISSILSPDPEYTLGLPWDGRLQTFGSPEVTISDAQHNAPQDAVVYSGDDSRNIPPEDVTMQGDIDDSHIPQNQQAAITGRGRYNNVDWERHKEEIRKLYLMENKILDDTMRIMKAKHSVPESKKLYKERFKTWGWQKNLPGDKAQWMTQKATKRKREDKKETIFLFGGQKWDKAKAQRSATRSKKVATEADFIVVDTPSDIVYKTPGNDIATPQNTFSPRDQQKSVGEPQIVHEIVDSESETEEEGHKLTLNWRGHSRAELVAIFDMAQSHTRRMDSERTEAMFLKALKGYGYLLGPTHEDATKVAFAVASFYAEQGRDTDTDKIIENLCQQYLNRFGIEHRRSQQLILQVVELLNGWNRHDDALAFLAHSAEVAAASSDTASSANTKRREKPRRDKRSQQQARASSVSSSEAAEELLAGNDPAQIGSVIELARTRVAAKDETVEVLLNTIIEQCERDPEALETQSLRARCELLKLYTTLGQSIERTEAFMSAILAVYTILDHHKWDKKSFKSFEVMEAVLELAAHTLKAGFEDEAAGIFRDVEQKAENTFGWDQERTVWAKITIGIVYQRYKGWKLAKPWFDHAYSASFAANGDEDGVTMSLQAALDKQHFSYISDEGRPFKTIFGVTGFSIRPNRLHLD
ncbi:hypothetical protein MMC17_004139 [Xylographa soralifera]|nr:hypothetical protein [Xylographa soralifera]